ncbi:MAG TPA: hypothetical protein VHK24_11485 [Steroidobacter sp.]|jgi:hypothetical protein|nr:hypothetical protein [Steroidobacter sp.]
MRETLLALLIWAAPIAWPQARALADSSQHQAATKLFDGCADSAPVEAIGLEALEAACPGLQRAIAESAYAPFISDKQRAELSGEALYELKTLMERDAANTSVARAPDLAELMLVMKSLQQEQQSAAPVTWFERLKQWLRKRFVRQQDESWLKRWLERIEINPTLRDGIAIASIILIIGLALVFLINELRVAGVFRRDAPRRLAARGDGSGAQVSAALVDLDRTPLHERASLLFRLLVAALVRSGHLQAERSLTHRELVRRAALGDDSQRACFQSVALLAERIVYGGGAPLGEMDSVISDGRKLLDVLSGAAR